MILALLLQAAAPAACPTPAPVPPALTGWARPIAVVAGGDLLVGTAASLTLQPQGAVRFAVPPARTGKADSLAGQYAFRVARAGTYRVALDAGVWVDVVAGGRAIASGAHGHGPACSGVRKMVDFRLPAGRYVLQLSGAASPAVRVMVARID